MVTSIKQAIAIQRRRIQADKNGIAKAVRRFLIRNGGHAYDEYKAQLTVRWPAKKKAA